MNPSGRPRTPLILATRCGMLRRAAALRVVRIYPFSQNPYTPPSTLVKALRAVGSLSRRIKWSWMACVCAAAPGTALLSARTARQCSLDRRGATLQVRDVLPSATARCKGTNPTAMQQHQHQPSVHGNLAFADRCHQPVLNSCPNNGP